MSPIKPLLLGLGLFALAGCDTAEQAAESFAKKVEEAAVETARESLGDTIKEFDKQVDQLNEQVDQAQENTRQWMDQAKPKSEQEQPPQDSQQQPDQDMIET
jgi:prefoldin subunit 5